MKKVFSIFAIALLLVSCGPKKKEVKLIDAANFNTQIDGKSVSLYTLHNGFLTMQVTNYGGRVVALWMPDRRGSFEDIVLGYDNINKYINNEGERYLGAVVGRCANRISNATFTLNDVEYQLAKNDGENTLHGGLVGADKMVWDVVSANDSVIKMHALFADGLDGFPGNLDVTMSYTLTHDNQFQIRYTATTDAPTLCNFSHHSFFNLKGEGNGTILDHELQINARYMTIVDEHLIPTGKFYGVKETPFDFREKHTIGERIGAPVDLSVQFLQEAVLPVGCPDFPDILQRLLDAVRHLHRGLLVVFRLGFVHLPAAEEQDKGHRHAPQAGQRQFPVVDQHARSDQRCGNPGAVKVAQAVGPYVLQPVHVAHQGFRQVRQVTLAEIAKRQPAQALRQAQPGVFHLAVDQSVGCLVLLQVRQVGNQEEYCRNAGKHQRVRQRGSLGQRIHQAGHQRIEDAHAGNHDQVHDHRPGRSLFDIPDAVVRQRISPLYILPEHIHFASPSVVIRHAAAWL